MVKPGGRLLYATCSLLNEENEQQVEHFLKNNEEFEAIDFDLPQSLKDNFDKIKINGNQLRTLPALSKTDGFFVALLQKKPTLEDSKN